MGLKDRLASWLIKSPKLNYMGTSGFWEVPPQESGEGYLQAYRTVGTLHAVVSRIATAVGESKWRLYSTKSGRRKEITDHPLLKLLTYVNKFDTGNELFEMSQITLDLVGEAFWVLNFTKGGVPAEIWVAEPHRMTVVPDPELYIKGYTYRHGSEGQSLTTNEVIFFKYPDPANRYRGLGPAQAAHKDINVERFTRTWQERFFYNNAEPQGILSIPGVDEDDLKLFEESWKKKFGGMHNARKTAFVNEEIKYERIGTTPREMDFWRSDKANRDRLLLALGMPLSVMGISENVNRANAEAGEFLFTRWVVRPRLVKLREKMNEQLVPKFGPNLELDFDEPVPQTKEMLIKQSEVGVKTGFLTINEARQALGYDKIGSGNVLLVPVNMAPQPTTGDMTMPKPEPEGPDEGKKRESLDTSLERVHRSLKTDDDRELYWKVYVDKAENYEKVLIPRLAEMFGEQEAQVLAKLKPGVNINTILDKRVAKRGYKNAVTPVMFDTMAEAVADGANLIKPTNPHKANEPLNQETLDWIDTRIGWAAAEVGEETAELLASTLRTGMTAGEDMRELAKRVNVVFDQSSKARSMKIARTEVLTASNEGTLIGYEKSGVVEKVEVYTAFPTPQQCPTGICPDMHGEIMNLANSHGVLPLHVQCRCIWLPV